MDTAQISAMPQHESKLLKRRLPRFEGARSYEAALSDDGRMKSAMETFEADYRDTLRAREEANAEQATLEQEIDSVLTCIAAQNSLREVLYKTIGYCAEERDFEEVEAFIADSDEVVYSHALQTPYSMIQMLKRSRGLEERLFDADGQEITSERMAELSQDEIEEIAERATLKSTEAGLAAVAMITPRTRLENLIERVPHRRETFLAVLEHCIEPKKFPEIQKFFEDNPDLVLDKVQAQHTLSCDYYVDKLEKAGGLVWKGAWATTPEGKKFLSESLS